MQKPIVLIFENPFDVHEFESIVLEENTSIITFLQKKYPNGFKRGTRVYLNNTLIDADNFDYILKQKDTLKIKILPEEGVDPLVAALTGGIVTGAAVAVINNKPAIPTIDQPEQLSNLKKPGGNAYNLREQTNLARLNEAIPSQYGKVKWFPDLAAAPYIRFDDRLPVVRYLLCLGHGQHQIDNILIGPTSIVDSSDVTATLYNPGDTMTEFSDNVFTIPDKKNINFKSAARNYVQCEQINFHKSNHHITFPDSRSKLTNVFSVDDEIRVYGPIVSDFNGVFTITDVTDQRITVSDTTSWASADDTIIAQIYKEGTYVTNPFQSLDASLTDSVEKGRKLGYLPEGSNTGIIEFENPYLKDFSIEIDFEAPQGAFARSQNYIQNAEEVASAIYIGDINYLIGLDDTNTPINNHYELNYSGTMTNTVGNTYQLFGYDSWTDPSTLPSDIKFPTISTDNLYYFTEDDIQIDESDISSIDYTNRTVTFNTLKTGTIKVHNYIYYYDDYRILLFESTAEDSPPSFNSTVPIRKTAKITDVNRNISTVVGPYTKEYNLHRRYQLLIGNAGGYNAQSSTDHPYGGQGFNELYDNVIINRIKIIYPDVKEYPNVSLLALTITNSPVQQYTESNNVAVISTRKLLQYDGTNWTGPTATRSIVWALADVWMSTYGASRPESQLDLTKLMELDTTFTNRGDTFDAVFDSNVTIWEALTKIARAGRTKCVFEKGTNNITFVRDEAQTIFKAAFGPNNILPNSFKINYSFNTNDGVRGVKVKFNDEDDQYTPTEIYSSENKGKYQDIEFFGVVNYNQAWRESQYLEAQLLSSNEEITFATGLAGFIPFYGDLISLQYDLPNWGQGGYVVQKDTGSTRIVLSEPIDTTESGPYYLLFQKNNGEPAGPYEITINANGDIDLPESLLNVDWFRTIGDNQNPTLYQFGTLQNYNKACVVQKIKVQKDNNKMTLQVVPYNADIHTADTGVPPAKPSVTPNLLPIPPIVGGLELTNVPNSGTVIVKWNPLIGIDTYKVQKSTDNVTYVDVSNPTIPTETILATGILYVRVASVIDSNVGRYQVGVIKAT